MLRLGLLHRGHAIGWSLLAEAVTELTRARLVTLMPPRVYLRKPGALDDGDLVSGEAVAGAQRIGRIVEAVSRRLPFRALCLQQAIATRRMLLRRQLPATLCLGVSTEREDRSCSKRGHAAHAWVCIGEQIVCGDGNLERYAVVARFPAR
jgi:hypothetical protein